VEQNPYESPLPDESARDYAGDDLDFDALTIIFFMLMIIVFVVAVLGAS